MTRLIVKPRKILFVWLCTYKFVSVISNYGMNTDSAYAGRLLRWQKMISSSNWPFFFQKYLHFNNSAGFCSKISFGVFNGYSGPGAFHTRHAFPYSPSPIRGPTMSICFFSVGLIHLPMDKMATTLADDNFNCIFLNENDRIWIQFPLKFVPRSPMDNEPALVQIMAWHRTGDKPLPEPTLNWFTDASMWH